MAQRSDRRAHLAFVIAAVVLAAAFGAAAHPVPPPPTLVPMSSHTAQQLMVGLVDPAADGIWNSVGSIVTPTSEEAWAPSTDTDWQHLEGHAKALARGAEALIDPIRVNGRADWAAPARALRRASATALVAAQRRDTTAIGAASEQMLDACQQCHKHYWLPTESAP